MPPPGRLAALTRVVQGVTVDELIHLSADNDATPDVRALVDRELTRLVSTLRRGPADGSVDEEDQAHRGLLTATIARHLSRPAAPVADRPSAPDIPPGSPIGEKFTE